MARRQKFSIDELKVSSLVPVSSSGVVRISFDSAYTADVTGTADTDGGFLKVGNSSNKFSSSVANMKFIGAYFESSATSGDNRGMYLRTYFSGAGGGGDCARIYATVSAACTTVHGAHISASQTATGDVSGQMTGVRATLELADDDTIAAGTYSAAISEVYFNGDDSSTTDISGATTHAIHRFIVAGDTTARALLQNVFSVENVKSGTAVTDVVRTNLDSTNSTDGLRILVNGNPYHLLMVAST